MLWKGFCGDMRKKAEGFWSIFVIPGWQMFRDGGCWNEEYRKNDTASDSHMQVLRQKDWTKNENLSGMWTAAQEGSPETGSA